MFREAVHSDIHLNDNFDPYKLNRYILVSLFFSPPNTSGCTVMNLVFKVETRYNV